MEAKEEILEKPGGFNDGIYHSVLAAVILKITPSSHEKKTEANEVGRQQRPDNPTCLSPRTQQRAATACCKKYGVHPKPATIPGGGAETPAKRHGEANKNLLQKISKHPLLILKSTGTEKSEGSGETLHASLSAFRFFFKLPWSRPIKGATTACPVKAAPPNNGMVDEVIPFVVKETRSLGEAQIPARSEGTRVRVEAFNDVRFNNDWRRLFRQLMREGSVRTAA